MEPIVAFIFGLLIGWLIEWVIDWFYWRRKRADGQSGALESCRGRVRELEEEVSSYQGQLASLREERDRLMREPSAAPEPLVTAPALTAEMSEPTAVPGQPVVEAVQRQDRLEDIRGIRPEVVQRLNAASVYTFADLAGLSPARLREITGPLLETTGMEVDIIREARLKAGVMQHVDKLEVIDGIGPVIARLLNNAGIFTFADLAALSHDELRALVGDRIQRLANEEKILDQARRLAERQV